MKWSQEEIDNALELIRSGNSYKEISLLINRSEGSVRNKMADFGEKSSFYHKTKSAEVDCLQCGSTFIDLEVRGRKFCSHSCNATFNNKVRSRTRKHKTCAHCGKDIGRKKKYCNHECHRMHDKKIVIDKIESGDITLYETNYKKYLINKHGEKCMECGWDKVHSITGKIPIQIEHIDGNSTNNSLENLKLLCPNCHSLTPTYGALNKGSGRKNRKR